jgi:hypothetical protein
MKTLIFKVIKHSIFLVSFSIISIGAVQAADTFSITETCQAASLAAATSGGQCTLNVLLADTSIPATAQISKILINVNNVTVSRTLNDVSNLPLGGGTFADTSIQVTCGAIYTATAFVLLKGSSTFQKVGNAAPIQCP